MALLNLAARRRTHPLPGVRQWLWMRAWLWLWLSALAWPMAAAAQATAPAILDEVPFITTPDHVTVAMLELAGVGPRDHVIDLGSGDGRIVVTAAARFGASGLGVDIVSELVQRSRDSARRAGVEGRTRFEVQDLFNTDLAPATVVTMYLLPEVNLALRPRLLALAAGTRIVSHDWDLGDWAPDITLTLDVPQKTIGLDKRSRLHLWTVPARVDGLWCSASGGALRIEQRFQNLLASLDLGDQRRSFSGRVHGKRLHLLGADGRSWTATVQEGRLVDARFAGAGHASAAPQAWQRAGGTACR